MTLIREGPPVTLDIIDGKSPVVSSKPPKQEKPAHKGFFRRSEAKSALRKIGITLPLSDEYIPAIFEEVTRRAYAPFIKAQNGESGYVWYPARKMGESEIQSGVFYQGNHIAFIKDFITHGHEGELKSVTVLREGRCQIEIHERHGREPLLKVFQTPLLGGKKYELVGKIGGASKQRNIISL